MSGGDTRVRKRSVTIGRHRTSISLEPAFWDELAVVAARRGLSLNALVAEIDRDRLRGRDLRDATNLSSALRLCVLDELRRRAADAASEP
ncbi:MAG TPA: ribbon-helix-helix domain-containing protein [Vineibacter sp.]|nr:ribbon-helix-helix domain-containing protein [Vineibacter sp.]